MLELGFATWLVVNVLATSFVSRRVENGDRRIAYYTLIWCLPLFGAIAATITAAHRAQRRGENSPS